VYYPSNTKSTGRKGQELTEVECDYRNYNQTQFLAKIPLTQVAIVTSKNITVKDGDKMILYLVGSQGEPEFSEELFDQWCSPVSDGGLDDQALAAKAAQLGVKTSGLDRDELIEALSDLLAALPSTPEPASSAEESETESVDSGYVSIDDFPIEQVLPIVTDANVPEEEILKACAIITESEEEINELAVQDILDSFDAQKELVKSKIFDLHKQQYHLRRDISDKGQTLQRILALQARSVGEKDRVRFKIDRMLTETTTEIDRLNFKLEESRRSCTQALEGYRKYLDRFSRV
jgi:hypothetical protein